MLIRQMTDQSIAEKTPHRARRMMTILALVMALLLVAGFAVARDCGALCAPVGTTEESAVKAALTERLKNITNCGMQRFGLRNNDGSRGWGTSDGARCGGTDMTTPNNSASPVGTLNPFDNSNDAATINLSASAASGVVVGTTAELLSALKTAKAGDTILLKPGTYSKIDIAGLKFSDKVTITSLDPSDKAVFTDLNVRQSSNVALTNIELTAKADAPIYVFKVADSNSILLDKLTVTGASHNHEPFVIRSSSNVTLSNSEITNAMNALNLFTNTNVTIADNLFHNIRVDGVRGNVTTGLTIERNLFTNFYPRGEIGRSGDHADAIQIWTENTNASASKIRIDSNVYVRGDGLQIQGIFVHDNSGTKPPIDLTITNNLIAGGMYNGIFFTGRNVTVTDNKVVGYGDQLSWLKPHQVSGGTIANNVSTRFEWGPMSGVSQSRNDTITNGLSSVSVLDVTSRLKLVPELGNLANGLLTSSFIGLIGLVGGAGSSNSNAAAPESDLALTAPPVTQLEIKKQYGTDAADRLVSSGVAGDEMYGGGGNDNYVVRHANDVVIEQLDAGRDAIYSDVSYQLGANVEELWLRKSGLIGHGSDQNNRLVGWDGDETLYGHGGNDLMQGEKGNDTLYGGDGNDDVRGGDGDDALYGEAGDDILFADAGNDALYGGDGNDVIEGGAGNDVLHGGAGTDQFRFRNSDFADGPTVDIIADFNRADRDMLNLTLIDANTTTAANDVFRFVGAKAFSNSAGELRAEVIGDATHVYGDVDGDGVADFTIVMQGLTDVTARDFWL